MEPNAVIAAIMFAGLGAATVKANDLIRYVRAADWNGALGTVAGPAVAIGFLFLASAAHALNVWHVVPGLPALGDWSWADKVLIGYGAGATGQLGGVDFRNAIDNTSSATTPRLLPATDRTAP